MSEYNAANFRQSLNTISRRSHTGQWVADVNPADFEGRTNEAISFIAGYVEDLLGRIEALEARASAEPNG